MKNLLFFLIASLILLSCKTTNEANAQTPHHSAMNKETKPLFGSAYLIGKIDRNGLLKKNYKSWFMSGYDGYQVDEATVAPLKGNLENIKIKVFMGTWCPDSRREVPHFYKILDHLQFNPDHLVVISMDKYKETPEEYEVGLGIQRVPTFIFYENDEEIGRIVESPTQSLEADMVGIIQN